MLNCVEISSDEPSLQITLHPLSRVLLFIFIFYVVVLAVIDEEMF